MTLANGHANGAAPPALAPFVPLQAGPVLKWPPEPPHDVTTDAKPDRWRHAATAVSAHREWLAAIPVILVNAVAFGAQLGFWHAHLRLLLEAVLVALALESIAIYLAWQAHLAQLADDSALRLRLAAYSMALLIGTLNYSHFMLPGWRPTVAAVTFGMMSVISPWLWSVHSRRASRDALKRRGLIEPRAVRLGATRWMWHPLRCVRVMSRAAWAGENDPSAAIALPAIKAADDGEDEDAPATAETPVPVPSEPSPPERIAPAVVTVKTPPIQPSKPASKRPPGRPSSGRARAAAVIAKDGTLTDEEVARRAKVSESTARRARTPR